ncbi:MAG: 2-oxoacid:acceptor oxidoreductase family protein [Calditrichia bacterium]|nr:2-oxoacid:acceptor oxidoreductase family protein [Calditrichia bacterium]
MKKNTEIRIAGFGGQGIILAGYIIGKAAAIFDEKHSTLIQSFGPEARGSSCAAQVTISDTQILYPYLIKPNICVLLSKDAYERFSGELDSGDIMLIEKDLVHLKKNSKKISIYAIPATRLAEEMGRKIVTNIIMVGFFSAVTQVTSYEATRKAVESSVPPGTEELNLKAFETGYNYGKKLLSKSQKDVA